MLDVLVGALVYSNLLALLAIGLSLMLLTCRVSNFAHGDVVTTGLYAAYTASVLLRVSPYACIPFALLAGGLVSLLSFLLVFDPLRRAGGGPVTLMVASMAVGIIIRYSLHAYADVMQRTLGVYTRQFVLSDFELQLAGLRVPGVLPLSSLTAAVLLVSLYVLLYRTRLGVAMRAAIENPQLAESLGIDVKRVFAIGWFLSGALAGAAGVFLPFRVISDPDVGWSMLLPAFASVVVGGIGSLAGSVAGAYVVGFSELLLSYLLATLGVSTAYRPLISFAAIVATLLLRPKGLSSLWSR